MKSRILWPAVLILAFVFRLAYGLSSIFWTEDERQTYLIGLRSFARNDWPFFGGDVVWTGSQLPGALQGLLVRWPLEIWPAPEAPFVLLNLLSFGALAMLAWYTGRRLPEVPPWLVWGALLTLPWTVNFSTHIVNTSYILPGAVVFFVGFFEATPALRTGVMPVWLAWFMMGGGLLFLTQIHMSWVLLPAYVLVALVDLARRDRRSVWRAVLAFVGGAALPGSLLVPTLLEYGWMAGGVERTVQWQPLGPDVLLTVAARFLSFASFETNRFLGLDTAERLMFLWRQPWALPFVAGATLIGLAQPLAMAVAWFKRCDDEGDWTRVKWLAAATVAWIYASFFFSVRGPLAHAFYVVFPVSVIYAASCWRVFAEGWSKRPIGAGTPAVWVERVALATLVSGLGMHIALMIDRAPRQSLYVDRALVQAAISAPNDRFLGDRRETVMEAQERRVRPIDPVRDAAAYAQATASDDLILLQADWQPTVGRRVSRFVVSIHNVSEVAAYLDVRYTAEYVAADGVVVSIGEGILKEILQPGETRTWPEVTQGLVPDGAVSARLALVNAEKCIPARQ